MKKSKNLKLEYIVIDLDSLVSMKTDIVFIEKNGNRTKGKKLHIDVTKLMRLYLEGKEVGGIETLWLDPNTKSHKGIYG